MQDLFKDWQIFCQSFFIYAIRWIPFLTILSFMMWR